MREGAGFIPGPQHTGRTVPTTEYDLWAESLEPCYACGADCAPEDLASVDIDGCEELACYGCAPHYEEVNCD